MEDFEKDIAKVYESKKHSPDMELFEEIQSKTENSNSNSRGVKNRQKIYKYIIATSLVFIIIIAIIVSCSLNPRKNDDNSFYAESEIIKFDIEIDYAKNQILDNFNKYSFLFEDCTINLAFGVFEKNENKLIALSLIGTKNDSTKTTFNLDLVIDKKYRNLNKDLYKSHSTITKKENYTLYKYVQEESYVIKIFGFFEYKDYELYLDINGNDEELFSKFL